MSSPENLPLESIRTEIMRLDLQDLEDKKSLIGMLRQVRAGLKSLGIDLPPSEIVKKATASQIDKLGKPIGEPNPVNCFAVLKNEYPDLNLDPTNPLVRGSLITIHAASIVWPDKDSPFEIQREDGQYEMIRATEWSRRGF